MIRHRQGGLALLPFAGLVVALFLTHPVHAEPASSPPSGIVVVSDLTWAEGTVILDPPPVATLSKSEKTPHKLGFPRDRLDVAALKPGQVVVFRGVMLRRVRKVAPEGDVINLETEDVPLTAALRDAHIALEVPLDVLVREGSGDSAQSFMDEAIPRVVPASYAPAASSVAFTPKKCTKGTPAGFDLEACLERKDTGSVDASLTISRKYKGQEVAKFSATGSFTGVLKPIIRIRNHQLESFDFSIEDFRSQFEVMVAALGPGGELKFETPPIVKLPFLIGGVIPVELTFKAYTSLETILPGELASAKVKLDFAFDGDYGFSYVGGGTDVKTFASALSHRPALHEGSLASNTHVYIKFNIGVPRVEFTVFGKVLVPWFQNAISLAGYYTAPLQPASCRELKLHSVQAAGYDFSLLGFTMKHSKTIESWSKQLVKKGQCG